uniref:dTMP kinase n=1 Tax=Globodera pallida TaxID=36090 RepID=A0A183C5M2_GLOPA
MGRRGALIVMEGLDRSGKSTQAKLLLEHFQRRGEPARIQRFPDRDEPMTGPTIDAFLRGAKSVDESREAIHLIFASNRWLMEHKMLKELEEGRHLIVDRYSYSGIAYSLAKGLPLEWVCRSEVGLPRPDLVLFFDADAASVSVRGGFGEEVMERGEFQQKVYVHMNSLSDGTFWRHIDATRSIDEVHKFVVEEVGILLGKMQENGRKVPVAKFTNADFGI